MKSLRASFIGAAAIGILCLIGIIGVRNSQPPNTLPRLAQAHEAQPTNMDAVMQAPADVSDLPIPALPQPPPSRDEKQPAKSTKPSAPEFNNSPGAEVPPITVQPARIVQPTKPPLKDPLARVALFWVGADPDAEAYWFEAINDPNLPENERQDLIEDLNEVGLADPKHPTMQDLPLIVNRISIVEQVGPSAMDQVNADAFQEAYKDLVNLANVAIGAGEPVK